MSKLRSMVEVDMTFYEDLKDLCKKYGVHAGVYVRSKDPENMEKHQVFCITNTDEPTMNDVRMTMETIMYFVNALYLAATDKFYATHVILDLISTVIKSNKENDEDIE